MGVVTIGVDIGQKSDPTAIAVSEVVTRLTGNIQHDVSWHAEGITQCGKYCAPEVENRFAVRFLERLTLGTSYPDVAERLAEIVAGVKARGVDRMEMRVDATGVGAPVVDILRQALRAEPCLIVAVTFSHGDRYEPNPDDSRLARLGKAHLVSRLQALLQTGRLDLPQTPEARALADELQTYEIKIDQDGNDKYGAFKTGRHDDLATALGLAVLTEPRQSSAVGAFVR